jgi:hypothetical protein
MVSGNSSVFQLFDPFGWAENSIAEGNIEVGYSPIIFDITVGGLFGYVFVMFDAVMEPMDCSLR